MANIIFLFWIKYYEILEHFLSYTMVFIDGFITIHFSSFDIKEIEILSKSVMI